jgi:predicted ATPase
MEGKKGKEWKEGKEEEEEEKSFGKVNFFSRFTGIFRKNNPNIMSDNPNNSERESNLSPRKTYAMIDSIKALIPSHAQLTINTVEPCKLRIR